MIVTIAIDEAQADAFLPANKLDGSGVGVNYADAYLKAFRVTLEDGRKLLAKRRGIRITLTIGDARGEGLLRRLVHGPDPKVLLRAALSEAAAQLGATLRVEPGRVEIEIDP
jgi:hypothetical protein